MTEDPGTAPDPAPGPVPGTLEVTVLRSGGVAGMVRRWSAGIPDDGAPAARAARRISGLGPDSDSPGDWRSKQHWDSPRTPVSGGTVDRQTGRGPVRDGFQWTVTCGDGSLRCDDADRRMDPDVDELIRRVTASPAPDDG